MVAIGIGSLRGGLHKPVGTHAEMFAHEDVDKLHEDSGTDNEETDVSTDEESEMSDTGIAPLVGMTLATRFGVGTIENIHEFELARYCTIRLSTCGTLTMVSQAVVDLLKKEKIYSPIQEHASKGGRLQNLRGFIRMYNPAKGWGFIVCDEFEGDIFLHSKHMVAPAPREYIGHFQSSQGGHMVRFDLDLMHRTRPQALNVRVVGVTEQEVTVYPKRRNRMQKTQTTSEHFNDQDRLGDSDDTHRDEAQAQYTDELGIDADDEVVGTNGACDPSVDAAQLADTSPPPEHDNEQIASDGFQLSLDSHLAYAKRKGVLRMRGLPFTARTEDVAEFFRGYGVRAEDVTMGQRADGSASGEALVLFARDELAEKARKEKHMQHIGHRYIELFNAKTVTGDAPAMSLKGTFGGVPEATDLHSQANGLGMPAPGSQASAFAAYAAAVHASHIQSSAIPVEGVPTLAELSNAETSSLEPPQANGADQSAWEQDLYQQYFQYFQQTYASVAASQAMQAVQALQATEASKQQIGTPSQLPEQTHPAEDGQHLQQDYLSHQPTVGKKVDVNHRVGGAPGLGEANKMSGWQKPVGSSSTHLLQYYDGTRMHYYNEI